MCEQYHRMNQAKRQLSMDMEMSWEDDSKRLRTSMLVTCLEDLSNELIYEIFEYFTAQEIFQQFSNLNQRFENVVYHSNVPLKVNSTSSSDQSLITLFSGHSNRILSIHLSNQYALMEFFNFAFYRLESITLDQLTCTEILSFLPRFSFLPRLFSLTISLKNSLGDPQEIYRSIFRLPKLRYNKISSDSLILPNSSLFITNEQCHCIEHLVINYPCTLRTLYDILSYLPNLRRLIAGPLFQFDEHILSEIPRRSFHLTHCTIRLVNVKFNELEMFLKNLSSRLRVLHLTVSNDETYLDPNRWERLFKKHIPFLQTLHYKYFDENFLPCTYGPHHALIHQFTSPFWREKGWMLNIECDITHWKNFQLIYSIEPYKKIWYESSDDQRRNTNLMQTTTQLTIRCCHFQRCDQEFIDHIRFLGSLATITSLHIEINEFAIDILILFLQLLPNLDTLTLVLTNSSGVTPLTQDQIERIDALSKINQIIKVNIEQHVLLNHIDVLMNLCPRMQFLRIRCQNSSQMELLLRLILMKRRSTLSSFYFVIANADESMVIQLQTLIYSEKLLEHYTIQRMGDQIALYW